jgi:hypothetical protein
MLAGVPAYGIDALGKLAYMLKAWAKRGAA